jgi:hypothetical protein
MATSRGTTTLRIGQSLPDGPPKRSKVDHAQLGPVFVNEPALQTISKKAVSFPEGSIIVREKPSQAADGKPEVLSVMIKRERGFNPDGGDWQFLLINGAGTKVKLHQKTGACLDCHKSQAQTDFVYPLK